MSPPGLICLLKNYSKDIEITDILDSVKSAIDWFSSNRRPDLIFQDIELNDGQCFEIYQNVNIDSPIFILSLIQLCRCKVEGFKIKELFLT
jgi:two-component SAPR family response regulator